jgi:prevent-host-death family protein
MTRRISANEVRAKFLAILDEVERDEEIEITRHGLTVARLVPAKGPHALRGRSAGLAKTAVDETQLYSTGSWNFD